MKLLITLSAFFVGVTTTLFAQSVDSTALHGLTGVIEGEIIDKNTKQEIIGAKIELIGTAIGTVSDLTGRFRLDKLAPRTYQLKITAPDYKPLIKSDVAVGTAQSVKLTLELLIDGASASEITVSATTFFIKSDEFKLSTNTLSQEEIRRAPGSVEDVSRMVLAMPGVATSSDQRNDIVARGGSPVENFTMVDGVEVPNINHFAAQGAAGGAIGVLNVDFLQDVTFSAGGFGVKYGDRLSSVMDIKYRDGDKNRFRGKFDLGFAGAGFVIEAPIQPGKSAFMLSARKSYLDLILGATGLTAVPNYSNVNLKATLEATPEHRFSLIGIGGIDDIRFTGATHTDAPDLDNITNNGWQYTLGISHKWLAGEKTFIQTTVSNNRYRYFTDVDSAGMRSFRNSSFEGEYVLRSDLSHRFSPTDVSELGVTARLIDNGNDIFIKESFNGAGNLRPEVNYSRTAQAYKFGAYLQHTKLFFDRLSLTAGLRFDYFSYLNNSGVFSPRLSASLDVLPNLKLNAAVGLYHQAPPMVWLLSFPQNRDLQFLRTRQLVGGLEWYPSEDLKVTFEVFDKDYRDYATSVALPQLSYGNAGAGFVAFGLEELVSESFGYARGVEIFLQKKLTSNFYAIANYSFSRIEFAGRDGVLRPSTFDFRHIITAILGYKFSDDFELSVKWRFVGSQPTSPTNLPASRALGQLIVDFNNFNGDRLPEYHRLDIRLDKRFFFTGWNIVTFIDIQNAYARQNVERLIWNERKQDVDRVLQFGFLPVGGVKVEF